MTDQEAIENVSLLERLARLERIVLYLTLKNLPDWEDVEALKEQINKDEVSS